LTGLSKALRLTSEERRAIGNRARRRVVGNFCVEEAVAKGLAFMKIDLAGCGKSSISRL
jgi:hypothetical protein